MVLLSLDKLFIVANDAKSEVEFVLSIVMFPFYLTNIVFLFLT